MEYSHERVSSEDIEDTLNKRATEGWRLHTAIGYPGDYIDLIFERNKPGLGAMQFVVAMAEERRLREKITNGPVEVT